MGATVALLAQAGCRVPAAHAALTCVDRIFTRVGAQDRIEANESTFQARPFVCFLFIY